MNKLNCEYVRDVYPDVLWGSADATLAENVRAHLANCPECRAEAALIESLRELQTPPPFGLDARVVNAVIQGRVRRRYSRTNVAMAATVAAALIGGSVIMQVQRREQTPARPNQPLEAPRGLGFVGVEDAMMSGEGSLDDLSVEELEMLLREIES